MTRADLAAELSQKLGTSLAESDTSVVTMLDSIVRWLRSAERVEIRGFGSFGTPQQESRIARNPETSAHAAVPAKRVASFKSSMKLQKLVNPAPVSAPPSSAMKTGWER